MKVASGDRRYYIDNLRWTALMLLIPYHTAQAWNTWGEPNYIFFEGNRLISGIIVFFSPFFMPLLFLLAGVSTRYALRRRTYKQYITERLKRLLVPLLFGTVVLMPVMTYLADRYNYSYDGGFFEHYAVFFTKFTDLTGADGGFSFGQFWFLLYLFVISVICVSVIRVFRKKDFGDNGEKSRSIPFPLLIALGLPLPLLSKVLSIGGKSVAEYTYLFLLGYFVFTDDRTVSKAEKFSLPVLVIGIISSALDVYLFLWTDGGYEILNTAAKYIAEWSMLIGLVGFAKKHLDFTGKVSSHMSRLSFQYYIYHFIWVVLFQYLLSPVFGNNTPLMFVSTILLSLDATLVCSEISLKIPFLCFLTGTKYIPKEKKT